MIKIEPLTEIILKEAISLVNEVFPEQGDEPANLCFQASLNLRGYEEFLSKAGIPELRYWVANQSGKVLGTVGLYCYKVDKKEAFWLGWFCVAPTVRKQGIGTQLLQFAIKEARKRGKRFLRLYTSTDPNELNAHKLYEKLGFKLAGSKPFGDTGFQKLYYELRL